MARRIECNLPGHEGEWIERIEKISRRQWHEWRGANYEQTWKLIGEWVVGWNLRGVDGAQLPTNKPFTEIADLLEVKFVPWLVQAIQFSIEEDMTLPPNLFKPSPTEQKDEQTGTA